LSRRVVVCWLLFERIHLITLVFGASLIGVAEDYGIYFFCRRLGADEQLGSWELLRRTLPALILTLVSTLIGYLGLVLTPFPGLRQMALFSASGLIFAWLTVVFGFLLWYAPVRSAVTAGPNALAEFDGMAALASDRRTVM
jgi:predicted exporter